MDACLSLVCFFFNDTATTEIYTLSLHDALPISGGRWDRSAPSSGRAGWWSCLSSGGDGHRGGGLRWGGREDRKSTRLNSSHANISYAVFCLKKKREARFDVIGVQRGRESVAVYS